MSSDAAAEAVNIRQVKGRSPLPQRGRQRAYPKTKLTIQHCSKLPAVLTGSSSKTAFRRIGAPQFRLRRTSSSGADHG